MPEKSRTFTDRAAALAGAAAASPFARAAVNPFALVNVVRKRAHQLGHGAPPLAYSDAGTDVATALEEIREAKIAIVAGGRIAERDERLAGGDANYGHVAIDGR